MTMFSGVLLVDVIGLASKLVAPSSCRCWRRDPN
jgi:hypothetical protein